MRAAARTTRHRRGARPRQAAAAGTCLALAAALNLVAAGGPGLRDARAAEAAQPAAPPSASGTSRMSPASATPAAPNSRHYLTTELDVRPGIMVRVQPAYPARAARENVSGKAVVRLYIDADGEVERVAVERATPTGYGFDDSAAGAFRAARFSPAMKDGKRVRAQMRIEVSFDAPPATPAPTKATPR